MIPQTQTDSHADRRCRDCGCTETTACIHPEFGPCWWVEQDLCSHCRDSGVRAGAIRHAEAFAALNAGRHAERPDPAAPRGSMANPSPYDCLDKLFPEEPYFVLRAKDPAAPGLVEMFAYLYSGQTQVALQKLQEIAALIAAAPAPPRPAGSGKFRECFLISDAMERWRQPGHRESGGAAE